MLQFKEAEELIKSRRLRQRWSPGPPPHGITNGQEAFIKVAPRIDTIGETQTGPYLRRSLLNLWKNHVRRQALERRHGVVSETPPPDVASIEDRDMLWQAVARLPEKQRACLVLRYYEDLSEKETARLMGVTVGTVKSHTARAIARLREELGHEYREPAP